MSHRSKFIY